MEVKQIYEFVNETVKEVLGDETLVQEDLSNIVDIGNAIFDGNAFDKYVRSLVNHIGRVIFVNRKYNGSAPSVLMDGWEYGSILQKISSEMPEAEENESWELIDGASYDPNIFRKPVAEQKFFNKKTTFEIDRSITVKQVTQSFSSAEQLNGFISMLYNEVDKAMTVMTDNLIMRTINNFTGETLHNAFPTGTYTGTHIRAVNLLAEYNTQYGTKLTKDKCMVDPAFIRFAAYRMGLYKDRLARISTLFNVGGAQRFTPNDMLHFVTLSDFNTAANIFLQSDVYHNDYVRLPKSETVPFWQGSGTDYSFSNVSAINVKTTSGDSVSIDGVLGVMFDRDALGVANFERRITTNYNPKAEFTNYFYKQDAQYFNDLNENFVVFFVQ
nr:MAG TPA: major capsid protein [Caudoviricetes sp.]